MHTCMHAPRVHTPRTHTHTHTPRVHICTNFVSSRNQEHAASVPGLNLLHCYSMQIVCKENLFINMLRTGIPQLTGLTLPK